MWSIFWLGDRFVKYHTPVSATLYFENHSIDLLTGMELKKPFSEFLKEQKSVSFSNEFTKRVMHLFYEAGYMMNGLVNPYSEAPLAVDIQYSESSPWDVSETQGDFRLKPIKGVIYSDYANAFEKGREHLMRGDCYQFNLTYPFHFSYSKKRTPKELCSKLWQSEETRAQYAHATYLPSLDKLFLSNSPECLFQARNTLDLVDIWTMPIKGTMPRLKDWKSAWKKLIGSKKDKGELDMITDLLRNDLTKIEHSYTKVIKRRAPLLVPKIVHQYSLIKTTLSKAVSLYEVIVSMFPGGSITGAPKKSVMKILSHIEKERRGFYCGSTLLLDEQKKCASINIRSSEIDLSSCELKYHAGGGITLLSKCEDEFLEMHLKKDSFVRNF